MTTSPYHPQANGPAERSVQTVENLLTKAYRDGKDPYISIMEYRNTPVDQIGSPAQLLMSRRLRSVIPTTKSLLQPKVINEDLASSKIMLQKTRQKLYYAWQKIQGTSKDIIRRASAYQARKNLESSCCDKTGKYTEIVYFTMSWWQYLSQKQKTYYKFNLILIYINFARFK